MYCADATCGAVATCPVCELAARSPAHRAVVAASVARQPAQPARAKAVAAARRAIPCVHEGAVLEWCQTCGPKEGRHVRDCDLHDRCTREYVGPAVRSCDRCADRQPAEEPT